MSIEEILAYLNEAFVRCTYGAVGEALGGIPARFVARRYLGKRRKEASWVVNARTEQPTGYTDAEKHPCLKENRHIIRSGAALLKHMREHGVAAKITAALRNNGREAPPRELPAPFSKPFAELAEALELGYISHRRAASLCGVTIDDLEDLFAAHGVVYAIKL